MEPAVGAIDDSVHNSIAIRRTRRERTPDPRRFPASSEPCSRSPVDFTPSPTQKYGQIWHTVVDTAGDVSRCITRATSCDQPHVVYPAQRAGSERQYERFQEVRGAKLLIDRRGWQRVWPSEACGLAI